MNKFIAILVFAAGVSMHAGAQSFLNELQQKKQGEGTVTVRQSADIDNLVNNAQLKAKNSQTAQQSQTTPAPRQTSQPRQTPQTARQEEKSAPVRKEHNNGDSLAHKRVPQQEHKETVTERKPTTGEHKDSNDKHAAKATTETETVERPVVDTSKKMMRNSYKITGYRIQAFSGGNSRADREKANRIGDAIKMKYPDQPVYVHFYSPRWICRVGNFRSYSEAVQLLRGIKAMGYSQACIVKGKINVAY